MIDMVGKMLIPSNRCIMANAVTHLEIEPQVPPRVAEEREWAAGAATGVFCLFLLGSDSNGLDNCSTDRDNEELSIDLEKALRGDNVGLQSFGVVAAKKYNINDIYIKQ